MRPLILDIVETLLPLTLGLLAFVAGQNVFLCVLRGLRGDKMRLVIRFERQRR